MALPQDGQNANGLTKVTEIPKGKELIFIDPTTNEGGIITLEDLTTQILKNLTSQTFALDQGTKTLPAALNELNSNSPKNILNHKKTLTNMDVISVDVSDIATDSNSIPFLLCLTDWTTGRTSMGIGCYRGNSNTQIPRIIISDDTINSVSCDGSSLEVHYKKTSYAVLYF